MPDGYCRAINPEGGNVNKVIEVTDQNFEAEVLGSDLSTVVDFRAPWCGPCRMVSPIYDKLSEEYDGRFKFCKINIDENLQMAIKYGITSIPKCTPCCRRAEESQ